MQQTDNTGIILLLTCVGVPFIIGLLIGWRITYIVFKSGWASLVPGPFRFIYNWFVELVTDD